MQPKISHILMSIFLVTLDVPNIKANNFCIILFGSHLFLHWLFEKLFYSFIDLLTLRKIKKVKNLAGEGYRIFHPFFLFLVISWCSTQMSENSNFPTTKKLYRLWNFVISLPESQIKLLPDLINFVDINDNNPGPCT